MPKLIVWDPGETTGYGSFEYDLKANTLRLIQTRELANDPSWLASWYFDRVKLRNGPKELREPLLDYTFVIEQFRLFASHSVDHKMQGNDMIAAVVRGRIETLAALLQIPITYHQPSFMKEISDELLLRKIEGLTALPPGEHRKDVLRHGLYWFLAQRSKAARR